MRVLLILDENNSRARILVRLTEKRIMSQVIFFLETNRGREAFELIKCKAEVEAYLPAGSKMPVLPQVTLVEDLL